MSKLEELVEMVKADELLKQNKEKDKGCNVLLCILAIIGAVAAAAGIAYAVYRFLSPNYLKEFEDEFADDDEEEEEKKDEDCFVDESGK